MYLQKFHAFVSDDDHKQRYLRKWKSVIEGQLKRKNESTEK